MDVLSLTKQEFHKRLSSHVECIYGKEKSEDIVNRILDVFVDLQPADLNVEAEFVNQAWDEGDIYLITYGNSFFADTQKPLHVLFKFLMKYMKGIVSTVHILPFFPFSSDDGFAVIDYQQVNSELGDWDDVNCIAQQFDLMADLVINHISSQSIWFQQFLNNKQPGSEYFIELDDTDDIAKVVRPRASELLQTIESPVGNKKVWCTFSADQVDLDFSNPDVFFEFVRILRFYMEQGVRTIRLDAVAFLWKQLGTSCINLPQTHEIVKVLRLIIERYFPRALFITETNIPNIENLKYFGNSNEAHIIYNFSLPPLLLNAMWAGNSEYLVRWSMSLPPAPLGCTYLNFTASHDGIGLRPAEGMLSDSEIDSLVSGMQGFGGEVTSRAISDSGERPYEINITWMSAMQGTAGGKDEFQIERFLCSQIVMLGLEGIPAFYIHSLLAGENDYEKLAVTQHKRSINRGQWDLEEVDSILSDYTSNSCKVFYELRRLIKMRSKQAAFHPNATQYTLHLGQSVFGFWRQSVNRDQSIFAIHNVTNSLQEISLANINLICTDTWIDLIAWDTIDLTGGVLALEPYQCVWITNKA
ncbi:MAG: sugar phosphorylase [Gammaproteobacteria bacterium]